MRLLCPHQDIGVLEEVKHHMKSLNWGTSAGEITLLPERGRIWQAKIEGHCAFWTNSNLDASADTSDFHDWNVGGDRLWVAPELNWFWKTRHEIDFTRYEVPRALDPGSWEIQTLQEDYCKVAQKVTLCHQHDGREVEVEMARGFHRLDWDDVPFFKSSLAYRTDNELWLRRGEEGICLDLWSIAQVPPGGTMSIGMHHRAQGNGSKDWRDYFAPIPSDLWEERANLLRLNISGNRQFKIGVAPSRTTGRMAYVRRVEEQFLVILRDFCPQPAQTYCDSPMHDPQGGGDAVQVYNDDGESGGFGEMEFHSPSLCFGQGQQHLMISNITVIGVVEEGDLPHLSTFWFSGE